MTIRPWRRVVQGGVFLLFIAIPLMNKEGITLLSGSLYSVAIGPLWITDPAIGMQSILATRAIDLTLMASLILPMLLALVCGRVFCGWLCPQNTLSEIADLVAKGLRLRRMVQPPVTPRPRYGVLALVLLLTALVSLPLVSLLSAPGIITVQMAKGIYEHRLGPELLLIAAIILVELFVVRRAWCNFICPLGTVLGLIRCRRTLHVGFSIDHGRTCNHCQACAKACSLGLDPVHDTLSPQCHNCGDCLDACKIAKEQKPLSFRW